MFERARITLTAWYVLIIMVISILFSFAFYQVSTREFQEVINRIEYRHNNPNRRAPDHGPIPDAVSEIALNDLENAEEQIAFTLLSINGIIFLIASLGGYFLAGRTLRPIQIMMDEQNNFISNASHELRTPLATMRAEMEAKLLEKHITEKQSKDLIKSNLEELTTLQDITSSLLQLSQMTQSTSLLTKSSISLKEVIQQAVKKVSPLAKKKQISITTGSNTAFVEGSKQHLIEVLVILLDNAIKYSKKGSKVKITITKHTHTVSLAVQDSGIGIPEKDISHIFDRFYRVDTSRSQGEGYGLGLSIAKKIINLHNGKIAVESTPEKGSIFAITLPLSSSPSH